MVDELLEPDEPSVVVVEVSLAPVVSPPEEVPAEASSSIPVAEDVDMVSGS